MSSTTNYDMKNYNKILNQYLQNKDKLFLANQLIFLLDFSTPDNLLHSKIILENKLIRDIYSEGEEVDACDLRIIFFSFLKNKKQNELIKQLSLKKYQLIPHILTDIDDTLFPNPINIKYINFSGKDTSWLKNKPYPGIKSFYKCFYNNISFNPAKYSTILTATPEFLKKRRFDDKNINEILGKNFGFLSGKESKIQALWDSILGTYKGYGILSPEPNSLAKTKFTKFKQYKILFPEYKLIFIGDNGQGDLIAGFKMIKYDPNCLVFIHNLYVNNEYIFDKKKINSYKQKRLYFFDNYLSLSSLFLKFKLITKRDFNIIKKSFISDINKVGNWLNYKLYSQYIVKKTKKYCHKSSKQITYNKRTQIHKY